MKPISGRPRFDQQGLGQQGLGQQVQWTEAAGIPGGNYPCARKLRLMAPGLAVEALVAIS